MTLNRNLLTAFFLLLPTFSSAANVPAPVRTPVPAHAQWWNFRAFQISAFQQRGYSFSGLGSWSPRYIFAGNRWRLGVDVGFTILHFKDNGPSTIVENTLSLGYQFANGFGWEAIGGYQEWLKPGKGFYTIGGNLFYAPKKKILDAIDRVIFGYQTLSLLGDRTHQVRIGVNFPFGSPRPSSTNTNTTRIITTPGGDRCNIRPVSVQYYARQLRPEEWKKTGPLPYIDGPHFKRHIHTLPFGQMTGILKGGVRYVKDSQIVFAIDVAGLPISRKLMEVTTANLKMNIQKVSKDKFTGTEMVCFLNEKICSGELIQSLNLKPNINPAVFPNHSKPINTFFAQQYLEHVVGEVEHEKVYAAEISLPLTELLKGSTIPNPKDFLYASDVGTTSFGRTIYVAVADDTYVSNDARLEIVYLDNPCALPMDRAPASRRSDRTQ